MPVTHSRSVVEDLRAGLPNRVETGPERLLACTIDCSSHRFTGADLST